MELNRKKIVCVVALCIASGCGQSKKEAPTVMYMMPPGLKTPLFEADSARSIKLKPGVTAEIVPGPCGPKSGILLMRDNQVGGYMACSCGPGLSGNCSTTNDNPEHPSCSGGCRNSENLPVPCEMAGPIIGPPRNPLAVVIKGIRETHGASESTKTTN